VKDSAGPRSPTLTDVAREAGVSVGTVSHVVSGARHVRPETRIRVERAIALLRFRPNRVARSLISDRTNTVAVVIPDVANPFFADLIRGAEDVFDAAEIVIAFRSSDNSSATQRRHLQSFLERRVDGVILAVAADADPNELHDLAERGPVVLVDRVPRGWEGDTVRGDDLLAMELVVNHLFSLGHRKIALVNGDIGLSTALGRENGFRTSMATLGLSPHCISSGSFTLQSGLDQALNHLASSDPPTAICAANDLLALGTLAAARRLGLSVPGDLSVTGLDDITYADLASPPLTTVAQPAYTMGATAARLVLQRLEDRSRAGRLDPRQEVILKPTLVPRQSTGSPTRGPAGDGGDSRATLQHGDTAEPGTN